MIKQTKKGLTMNELIKELKQEKMFLENKIKDDQHQIKLLDYRIDSLKKAKSRKIYEKAIKELKERKRFNNEQI
tara:strand:- start:451 stop:672 length:222 start_codon:yes stop_codon:yes gene_type:complete